MFNSYEKDNNRIETLIGDGCSILGSLKGENLLKINGYLEGNIIWENDVIIGETGYCKGDINCVNAYINGKVDGDICCSGILTIGSSGKVYGNISIKNIIIKDGGIFTGQCSIMSSDNITVAN